jgi:N-acetylglucosamine repressor
MGFMETLHKVRRPVGKHAGPHGALGELRRQNTVRLLSLLRRGEATTRAEMARITQLDPKTITNLTGRLLKDRLVVSEGNLASSGGRPAERLSLNPDGMYAVGVDLGATRLRTVVLDFIGAVRASTNAALRDPKDSRKILDQVVAQIREDIEHAGLSSRRQIAGIGFACPGFIDRTAGVALEAVHIPGWRNVPVGDYLTKTFQTQVHIEESSRVAALGELWFGEAVKGTVPFSPTSAAPCSLRKSGQSLSELVALDFGYGIGVGIVSRGRLHYGASESAGEIGHTTVKPNGELCHCGHRGCLETVASGEAIARLSDKPTAKDTADAARAGDARCRRVIAEAGQLLGIAVANLVNLLNPGTVILNGGLCNAGELLLDPFHAALKAHAVPPSLEAANIAISNIGQLAGAMGAAMLPMQSYFQMAREDGFLSFHERSNQYVGIPM